MVPLAKLIEDLRILVLGPADPATAGLACLRTLLDQIENSPELEFLTNDEVRAIKGFRMTVYRAASMERDTMLKHVLAHWMGTVDQALRKLSIGPEAISCVDRMVRSSEFSSGHTAGYTV